MNARLWIVTAFTGLCIGLAHLSGAPAASAGKGKSHMPKPPYPPGAVGHFAQGPCIVEIFTDNTGKVAKTFVMCSCGYDDLDEYTANFIRENWSGPPKAVWQTTIDYRLIGPRHERIYAATAKRPWSTPSPQGNARPGAKVNAILSGVIAVSTDTTGSIASAKIRTSTGNPQLDAKLLEYASRYWKGPPNRSRNAPVCYVTSSAQG